MNLPQEVNALRRAVGTAAHLLDRKLTPGEHKIYALVDEISRHRLYPWSSDSLVSLYQRLFVTQAALCELYFDYEISGEKKLMMTAVSVHCQNVDGDSTAAAGTALSEATFLPNFEFYQDEKNFLHISAEEVKSLLTQFWTRYNHYMNKKTALETLGLDEAADRQEIKKRFRELAARHHPDKGGDHAYFIDLRRAYESLKDR